MKIEKFAVKSTEGLSEKLGLASLPIAVIVFLLGYWLAALAFLLTAFLGWTRIFKENAARGRNTMTPQARLFAGASLCLIGTLAILLGGGHGDGSEVPGKTNAASLAKAEPACPSGTNVAQRDFVAKREAVLRVDPDIKSTPVTLHFGDEAVPAPLEPNATVRQFCASGEWANVRVLTAPSELQPLQGWVPASALKSVEVTKEGHRLYAVEDFDWPKGASSRPALVAVMNRIMADRPQCEALDTDNLVESSVRRGEYMVPCFDGGEMQSFTFTAADASNGRSFAPVSTIDKFDAIDACKEGVLQRASHPSTVEFPTFDYDFRKGDGGTAQVLMSVSAKNAFNLELEYDVECEFTGARLDRVLMSEAAH